MRSTFESKKAFVKFLKAAAKSKRSREYRELYHHLLDCFTQADTDFDGRIGPDDFDLLVEQAAVLPRKWGFAPTSAELYKTAEERREARRREFGKINTSGSGYICFEEWLSWSYGHICTKAASIDVRHDRSKMETSREDFRDFIVAAARSRDSQEYKELYHFLLDCFTRADKDLDGCIGLEEFDRVIEVAARAPRRWGFAPPSSKTYRGQAERLAARMSMYSALDQSGRGGVAACEHGPGKKTAIYAKSPFKSDHISFDEWLNFVYTHICQKAAALDPTLSGKTPLSDHGGLQEKGRCPYGFS